MYSHWDQSCIYRRNINRVTIPTNNFRKANWYTTHPRLLLHLLDLISRPRIQTIDRHMGQINLMLAHHREHRLRTRISPTLDRHREHRLRTSITLGRCQEHRLRTSQVMPCTRQSLRRRRGRRLRITGCNQRFHRHSSSNTGCNPRRTGRDRQLTNRTVRDLQ